MRNTMNSGVESSRSLKFALRNPSVNGCALTTEHCGNARRTMRPTSDEGKVRRGSGRIQRASAGTPVIMDAIIRYHRQTGGGKGPQLKADAGRSALGLPALPLVSSAYMPSPLPRQNNCGDEPTSHSASRLIG